MKAQLVLALVVLCAVAHAARLPRDGYTTKYDNIDLDQILASDRLLNNYFKCLMDTGRCTPDGSDLKRILPDALATDCTKCTEKQKLGSDKVVKYLINNKPEMWKELEAKYDPSGEYIKRTFPDGVPGN